MDFKTLYNRIWPRLKNLSRQRQYKGICFDEHDLYQEMCLHLWNNFKDGVPAGINDNYIVNGCRFHILNYIRKEREKVNLVSLEETTNDNGDTLKDLIQSRERPLEENVERNIIFEYVRNNGFTEREKEVFFLLAEGHTTREIGEKLGISHVMVIKYKKRIIFKFKK